MIGSLQRERLTVKHTDVCNGSWMDFALKELTHYTGKSRDSQPFLLVTLCIKSAVGSPSPQWPPTSHLEARIPLYSPLEP